MYSVSVSDSERSDSAVLEIGGIDLRLEGSIRRRLKTMQSLPGYQLT